MTKSLPLGVTAFYDRHKKLRYRFRLKGRRAGYIHGEPGSDEFWRQYLELKASTVEVAESAIAPGTFNDLIARYYRSAAWKGIQSETTRTVYRGQIERFRDVYGDRAVRTMKAKHIAGLMAKMADTPSAASNIKKRLSQIFDFAILLGWRRDNPTKPVRAPKSKSQGFHTWTEDEIGAFEQRWPIGTRERLAFDLLLYTGQRRSDVATMGPHQVYDGRIVLRQQKTGRELELPIHPNLRASIEATASSQSAFIATTLGKPMAIASFGNWFGAACRSAGLKGCTAHGLRKACARRLAELGLSNQLIKAVTGHVTDSEVARYTRAAEQRGLADTAMAAMSNRENPQMSNEVNNG